MTTQAAELFSPVQKRISRHRARHAVRVAGLPLWRHLVDSAEGLLTSGCDVGGAAIALRNQTARLPR